MAENYRTALCAVMFAAVASANGAAKAADCPVLDSRNWVAWINAMPGVDAKRRLHISGEVDLPTPGFVANWRLGPADRRSVPSQFVELSFDRPEGVVQQAISTETVDFVTDALFPQYASIRVRCGDRVIAEITDIDEVH